MVHEAAKAGLKFDEEKLIALNCTPTHLGATGEPDKKHEARFLNAMNASATSGFVHDSLAYHKGGSRASVAG